MSGFSFLNTLCINIYQVYKNSDKHIHPVSVSQQNLPGEFPGKNLVRQPLPGEKEFGFFTSPKILYNLNHPKKNIESLIVPIEYLNFIPMSF